MMKRFQPVKQVFFLQINRSETSKGILFFCKKASRNINSKDPAYIYILKYRILVI